MIGDVKGFHHDVEFVFFLLWFKVKYASAEILVPKHDVENEIRNDCNNK